MFTATLNPIGQTLRGEQFDSIEDLCERIADTDFAFPNPQDGTWEIAYRKLAEITSGENDGSKILLANRDDGTWAAMLQLARPGADRTADLPGPVSETPNGAVRGLGLQYHQAENAVQKVMSKLQNLMDELGGDGIDISLEGPS